MGKHYGEEILEEVLRLKTLGKTHREIGEKFSLSSLQIKELLRRYRKKENQKALGILPTPKGRPRTRYLTFQQKLESENKRLQRENDLLRSFLRAAGRM